MKTLKQLLSEKRRNPSQNPKSSGYEQLIKYKGRNDIFITFTSINKVGINPYNDFNTPTAVYTYPLNQIWNDIEDGKDATAVPFAGSRKFIQVIKPNGRFIHDLATKYTSGMYDKDMDILRKVYGGDNKVKVDLEGRFMKAFETFTKKTSWLKNEIKKLKVYSPALDRDTIDDDLDYLTSTIRILNKEIKEKKYVFMMANLRQASEAIISLKEVTVMSNYDDKLDAKDKMKAIMTTMKTNIDDSILLFRDWQKDDDSGYNDVEWSIEHGSKNARNQSWGGMMWNVTRLVSNGHSNRGTRSAVVKWNKILRVDLGYSGMADRSGKGIIHPAEPTQAIFLSKQSFKHIETINNTNHKETTDIKSMEDVFSKFGYLQNNKFDLEQIGGIIENNHIIPKNRKSFNKILHKYILDNADKFSKGQEMDVGAYLLYFDKFDKLSKPKQAFVFDRMRSGLRDPLYIISRLGIKFDRKVLNKKFAKMVNIPKNEWKYMINNKYLTDIYGYSKTKGYIK